MTSQNCQIEFIQKNHLYIMEICFIFDAHMCPTLLDVCIPALWSSFFHISLLYVTVNSASVSSDLQIVWFEPESGVYTQTNRI